MSGVQVRALRANHQPPKQCPRAGDDERHAQGLLLLANAELEQGSAAYRPVLEDCLRLYAELGQPRHRYIAETRRTAVVLLEGDLELAAERIDAAERARKAVAARIRAAISTIDGVLPELADHLNWTIVTGAYCRYRSDEAVSWDVDDSSDKGP